MRGRRELRRARKEAIKTGGRDDIIPVLVDEENPDVSSYREQLENAGISIPLSQRLPTLRTKIKILISLVPAM